MLEIGTVTSGTDAVDLTRSVIRECEGIVTKIAMADSSVRKLPYVTFGAFETFVSECAAYGIPHPVNAGAFETLSQAIYNQLAPALRFLGLLDDESGPTPDLNRLVRSYGTRKYSSVLSEILTRSYQMLGPIDLVSSAPSQLVEALTEAGTAPSMMKRTLAFYLRSNAAAGQQIGPRLRHGRRRSVAINKPATTPRRTGKIRRKSSPPEGLSRLRLVLDKFPDFDSDWTPEVQSSWLRSIEASILAVSY